MEYNAFNIDFSKPMKEQIWELNEDLVQVSYLRGLDTNVLDIGWYPEMEPEENAGFKIVVVKNQNWEDPIFSKTCRNEFDFFSVLAEAIEIAAFSN